jgi:hypothetical protein
VDVQTHTGAIALTALGGTVVVSSGSGAIRTDAIAGALQVTTTSGAFTGSQVGSSLRVRTQSGDVDAALTGHGDVDVETGSSAIRLRGVGRRRPREDAERPGDHRWRAGARVDRQNVVERRDHEPYARQSLFDRCCDPFQLHHRQS